MSSSDDLDAFSREARSWDEPSEALGQALKERLDRRIGAAAALMTSSDTDSTSTPAPRAFPFGLAASAAGIACVGLFVAAFRSGTMVEPPASGPSASVPALASAPRVDPLPAAQSEPQSLPEPTSPSAPTRTVDVRDLPNSAGAAPVVAGIARSSQATPSHDAIDGSLEEESKMLRAARTARLAGAPERSLALTIEHAARFPSGALAPERDAERISALCSLGRRDDARREIGEFEARWPSSALLERVRTSCRGVP